MNRMRRTQLLLPEPLWNELRRQARAQGKSASELVREATARYLAEAPCHVDWSGDPLGSVVGGVRSGTGDLAEHHDDYLYGSA